MTVEEKQLQRLLHRYKEAYEEKKGRLTGPARQTFLVYILETLNRLRRYAVEPVLLKEYARQGIINTQQMLYFLESSD